MNTQYKEGDIVCYQVKLEELFYTPSKPYYIFLKDWRINFRKLTESLDVIAYWKIKKVKKIF